MIGVKGPSLKGYAFCKQGDYKVPHYCTKALKHFRTAGSELGCSQMITFSFSLPVTQSLDVLQIKAVFWWIYCLPSEYPQELSSPHHSIRWSGIRMILKSWMRGACTSYCSYIIDLYKHTTQALSVSSQLKKHDSHLYLSVGWFKHGYIIGLCVCVCVLVVILSSVFYVYMYFYYLVS